MRKELFLLAVIISFSIAFSIPDIAFIDHDGNQITSYNFSDSLLGYTDNPDGFLKYCVPYDPSNHVFGLIYSTENLSDTSTIFEIDAGNKTPFEVEQISTFPPKYCANVSLDISPLKAVFPGKVRYIDYNTGVIGDLDLTLNGSYYAYIVLGENISFSFAQILDQNGNDILKKINDNIGLESKDIKPMIVLDLVDIRNGKVIWAKVVSPGGSLNIPKPNDFTDMSQYGSDYVFYANGLPVHLAQCNPCTGKPDGTKCSFSLYAPSYGCVNNNGNGVCISGVCHPGCDPSLNHRNQTFSKFGDLFNDQCYQATDGLEWFKCCNETNTYHVCMGAKQNCLAYCGELGKECCTPSAAASPCNPGLTCACTIGGGTRCVNSWEPGVILPWNPSEAAKNLGWFIFNDPSFGLISCCNPGSGCAASSPLPMLCQILFH